MKNFNGTQEEGLVAEAILAARTVQEFLWSDDEARYTDNSFPFDEKNKEHWMEMLQKRVNKIGEIDITKPAATVELRKRVLQQAALSIKMLVELERRTELEEIEQKKSFSVLAEIKKAVAHGQEEHITFRVAHLTKEWYDKVIQEITNEATVFGQAQIRIEQSKEIWYRTDFGPILIELQLDRNQHLGNALSRDSARGFQFPVTGNHSMQENVWYNMDNKVFHRAR